MNALIKQVDAFIANNVNAPIQKSAGWYAIKQTTIGGSEVGTVLGLNPFKKVHSLIAEKCGLPGTEFNGNTATRWGNLFESVTRDYTVLLLQMDKYKPKNTALGKNQVESQESQESQEYIPIRETGSIKGIIQRQRYSPDGLGVAKLLTGEGNKDYFIVLFEFKSPLRSVPDGKVPKQYKPQVLTGLLSIPIAETGLFVNNMYRKCLLKDLGFNTTYDTIFHDGDLKKKLTKKQKITQVYAVGMICFYQTEAEYERYLTCCGYGDSDEETDVDPSTIAQADPLVTTSEYDLDLLLNSYEQPIDFGESKQFVMDRLLELYEEKRIHAVYLPMVCNPEVINEDIFVKLHKLEQKETPTSKVITDNPRKYIKQQYNLFLADCDQNGWAPIGYMPWKLMKSDVISIDAEDNWQETIEEPIRNTLEIIDNILIHDDIDKRREVYNVYFPPIEAISKKDRELIYEGFDIVTDTADLDDNYEEVCIDEDNNETFIAKETIKPIVKPTIKPKIEVNSARPKVDIKPNNKAKKQ